MHEEIFSHTQYISIKYEINSSGISFIQLNSDLQFLRVPELELSKPKCTKVLKMAEKMFSIILMPSIIAIEGMFHQECQKVVYDKLFEMNIEQTARLVNHLS